MRFIYLIISVLFLCSCEKGDIVEPDSNFIPPVENNDEYYIKYSCSTKSVAHTEVTMSYVNEKGKSVTAKGRIVKGLTVTIGPVKYGFRAGVGANVYYSQIECCKNGGPFIKKAFNNGDYDRSGCSYTIDF